MSFGIAIGAVAGFVGGATDAVFMRFVDAALPIPRILVLIKAASLWEASLFRDTADGGHGLVRGVVLRAETPRPRARPSRARARRVADAHGPPCATERRGACLVAATLGIVNVILLEAGLSYLGIGVRPPTASWGAIIQDGAERCRPLVAHLLSGLAILVTVFCATRWDALYAFDPGSFPRYGRDLQRRMTTRARARELHTFFYTDTASRRPSTEVFRRRRRRDGRGRRKSLRQERHRPSILRPCDRPAASSPAA